MSNVRKGYNLQQGKAEIASTEDFADSTDLDLESVLFKPRGTIGFESEWTKWIK